MKKRYFTKTLPIVLILICPPFAMILWYVNVSLDGSFIAMGKMIIHQGFWSLLSEVWFSRILGSTKAWEIIGIFAAIQLFFMKVLPGKLYKGSPTPMGNSPVYKDNGLLAYIFSFALFFVFSLGFKLYQPSIIYDNFGDILAALNIFALLFCGFLLLKSFIAPSSSDCLSSGNLIFDYYWGRELHPNILGWDVKMFTNCRFGMIGWALSVTSFAFGQEKIAGYMDLSVLVPVLLIDMYLLKFFIWESGYMRSMDIAVDKAGFYICWGCLVWVPAVYTSPILFAVHHPANLGLVPAIVLFLLGAVAIWINYWADRQRQVVRQTDGDCIIWGKKPKLIKATYTTFDGKKSSNLLLASGFWGLSRHFHYIPELLAAFIWSSFAGFGNFMPFFYVSFLLILLVHRAYRDDEKCQRKYAESWTEYKKLVPHKIIPYVY